MEGRSKCKKCQETFFWDSHVVETLCGRCKPTPGEYVLPDLDDAAYDNGSGACATLYFDMEKYIADFIAAVEKAHSERNCENCWSFKETLFDGDDFCNFHKHPITEKMTDRFKCNDWKSKEADNG